jgi:hypothetical protein
MDQQQVAALKRRHVDGSPCWWCGKPMFLSQRLSGDHTIPRSIGGPYRLCDRLVHLRCNSERGDGRNDDHRPALTGRPVDSPHVDDRLDVRLMPWPDMA